MKKSFSSIALSVLLCTLFFHSFSQSETPLFAIGSDSYFSNEFNYAFSKNILIGEITKDSIDNYLKLYVNFRLKVKAAKANGYDTIATFKQEFTQYKELLENSYLSPKKEQEALVNEAYARSLWEIKAAHLLVNVDENATPKDTLLLFNKINGLRERAIKGEDFNQLAEQFSQDPSAKQNRGELGYFSIMQMVYPFETAAYTTAVGEISNPVRTQFGYHLIKVLDKRPNQGKVQVAHIMLKSSSKNSEQVLESTKNKIYLIDSLLKAGNDWNQICQKYSEDENSRPQNGELRSFERGQIVPAFENAAFALQYSNQLSEPIQTPFGWHIIKLIKKISIGSLEEERTNIARKVKSDARSSMPRSDMLNTLKRENKFTKNEYLLTQLIESPSSIIVNNSYHFDSLSCADTTKLFSIGTISVSKGQFLSSFNHTSFKTGSSPKIELSEKISTYEDSLIITYGKTQLGIKYPNYQFLLNEYYDGILLFSIMEDSVWNKSMGDSAGLKNYYEMVKENYASQIADTSIFISNAKPTLETLATELAQIQTYNNWKKLRAEVLEKYNVSPLSLQVVSKNDSKLDSIDELIATNKSMPFEINKEWYWIKISSLKKYELLNQVKGSVISDYQSYLDTKWIAQLRLKYPVNINRKELKKVYAKFKSRN